MESLNMVTLSGVIHGTTTNQHSQGKAVSVFGVKTNQVYRANGEKQSEDEIHVVKLRDSDTIQQYLTAGKPVVVVGRLKYSSRGAYINAQNVIFPERLS